MDTPAKRVEMLPAKRRALILDHLRQAGSASIQELAEAIGGSQSTVRRDLEHLAERSYVTRTHGGAELVEAPRATFEREAQLNAELRRLEKVAIGREAAKRLSPGDSVIVDGSSTVMHAIRAAAEREFRLTIVTNSLEIALFASTVQPWRVILPGGTVRAGYTNVAGEPGEQFLRSLHADICLTGASAVTGTLLTDSSLEVASLKRAMISAARRSVLLVDSSKFTLPCFCSLCDIAEMDEVITDSGIAHEALSVLKSAECNVTIVSPS